MKVLKLSVLILGVAIAFTSCKKEEALVVDDISGLGGDTWVKGPIDNWIATNYTTPYNIAVKYKWDRYELALNRVIVPCKEEKVIPVLDAIKSAWVDPYIAEAGLTFFNKYSPKFIVLSGSASYDPDNRSKELGTAEGGRKIVLLDINNFRNKNMAGYDPAVDTPNVKELFKTIYHEFGHILHQNILYPPDFKTITPADYTSDWNNKYDPENYGNYLAMDKGFISYYAPNNTDDDFVEMITFMLAEGKDGFDDIINNIYKIYYDEVDEAWYYEEDANGDLILNVDAQTKLRKKEAIVVNYFKQAWGIDFYSLQQRTRGAINNLLY